MYPARVQDDTSDSVFQRHGIGPAWRDFNHPVAGFMTNGRIRSQLSQRFLQRTECLILQSLSASVEVFTGQTAVS